MSAYYNEIDAHAAEWLRNLIAAGHIAPGDVDERDIRDVKPDDIKGYTQCHFFAGIGIWSHALRSCGWPDDRPVWTGSCPCQPFSGAGKGEGFDDERHLWPAWDWLVQQCRPAEILGEQVASKPGLAWFDLVSADLENKAYAVAAADLCAAGVGTKAGESRFIMEARISVLRCADLCPDPVLAGHICDFADDLGNTLDGGHHIRQRLYWYAEWMGDADSARAAVGLPEQTERQERHSEVDDNRSDRLSGPKQRRSSVNRLANATDSGRGSGAGLRNQGSGELGRHVAADSGAVGHLADMHGDGRNQTREHIAPTGDDGTAGDGSVEWVGHPVNQPRERFSKGIPGTKTQEYATRQSIDGCMSERPKHAGEGTGVGSADADHSEGRDADWLFCRDGKWRPVESGTFPLAHKVAGRVGQLRAYGNGLDAETAKAFVTAVMEDRHFRHTRSSLVDLL